MFNLFWLGIFSALTCCNFQKFLLNLILFYLCINPFAEYHHSGLVLFFVAWIPFHHSFWNKLIFGFVNMFISLQQYAMNMFHKIFFESTRFCDWLFRLVGRQHRRRGVLLEFYCWYMRRFSIVNTFIAISVSLFIFIFSPSRLILMLGCLLRISESKYENNLIFPRVESISFCWHPNYLPI